MHSLSSNIDCGAKDTSKMALREDCSAAIAAGMLKPIGALSKGKKGGPIVGFRKSNSSNSHDYESTDMASEQGFMRIADRV